MGARWGLAHWPLATRISSSASRCCLPPLPYGMLSPARCTQRRKRTHQVLGPGPVGGGACGGWAWGGEGCSQPCLPLGTLSITSLAPLPRMGPGDLNPTENQPLGRSPALERCRICIRPRPCALSERGWTGHLGPHSPCWDGGLGASQAWGALPTTPRGPGILVNDLFGPRWPAPAPAASSDCGCEGLTPGQREGRGQLRQSLPVAPGESGLGQPRVEKPGWDSEVPKSPPAGRAQGLGSPEAGGQQGRVPGAGV